MSEFRSESLRPGGRKELEVAPGALQGRNTLEYMAECASEFKEEYPETVQRIREEIEAVDFELLKKIYYEFARKSGVAQEDVNFIPKEEILILSFKKLKYKGAAFYDSLSNVIALNGDYLIDQNLSDADEMLSILSKLTHEYGHATSANRLGLDSTNSEEILTCGYHEYFTDSNEGLIFASEFNLFNEGLTEEVSSRVSRTYLHQSPILFRGQILNQAKFVEKESDYMAHGVYPVARLFIQKLSERLATLLEVPPEQVMNAFIAGNYQGGGLPREILDELVGKKFSGRLARAKTTADFVRLVDTYEIPMEIDMPSLTARIREYLGF